MGIPSYFSYIIKNYSNIIRDLRAINSNEQKFHHLYMDCNSIIYDVFREIENSDTMNVYQLEELIISNVLQKIDGYLEFIKPEKTAYIAFDGVAPLAKMEQQRSRRYKNISNQGWSTANITPGTNFMKKLSSRTKQYFSAYENKLGIKKILISTSDEPGEGEHKMFQYVRDNAILPGETGAVYGLDSDLIMLSIFHCRLFENLYIFREANEFVKSSITLNGSHSCYFMDIKLLSESILCEMQCGMADKHRIYDYVFLCFFLGNDFLPHFPSLNIRTHGITVLLDIYRLFVGNYADRFLISKLSMKINWKYVHLFLKELSKREHDYILQEYKVREKWDKRYWGSTTEEERETLKQSVPVIYRPCENYICPSEKGWEKRYYKCLFRGKDEKSICLNYLEGLEWVFKYYTVECPNWRWKYNYDYPPLLSDLCKHAPKNEIDLIQCSGKKNIPVSPNVQLAYVLPPASHHLLERRVHDILEKNYSEFYPRDYTYQWAFCRYLWEAHAELPEISDAILDKWQILLK